MSTRPTGWKVQFLRATLNPMLVGGGERIPVGIVVGCGAVLLALGWQVMSNAPLNALICAALGFSVLTVGMFFVRRMAKRDPQQVEIYLRSLKYRSYYPPKSTPFRRM